MNKYGFTKLEILILAAIIGILGLTAVFAVMTARSRTRDAVRMSDIRQLQAGLEMYFIDHNTYPESLEFIALGSATTRCLGVNGFGTNCTNDGAYLEAIGTIPEAGLDELSACSGQPNAYCYLAQDGDYRIQFELEHDNPLISLGKGANCATQSGLEPGACKQLPIVSE